jgi:hypothetical protein
VSNPERTDGPGDIARRAEHLLRELLTEWQELYDALWKENPPLSELDRRVVISRQVDLFGAIYLLACVRHLAPEQADSAAAALADEWDAGDSLGEWIYQWREELDAGKPLTLFFADDGESIE